MKKLMVEKVKEYFPNIENYSKEINLTEKFFSKIGVDESLMDEVFWNHLLSLLERIDTNIQNSLEFSESDEISEKEKDVVKNYIEEMNLIRNFDITDFEKFLLEIYVKKFISEKEEE